MCVCTTIRHFVRISNFQTFFPVPLVYGLLTTQPDKYVNSVIFLNETKMDISYFSISLIKDRRISILTIIRSISFFVIYL